MSPSASSRSGFTLIELAIVIVVIGLVIGGLIGGRALINRTRLTQVTVELGKYKTAYFKFKEQYAAVPGDFLDATEYWGSDTVTACSATPVAGDRVPKKETCNGDGNGQIGATAGTVSSTELFRTWQHLSNAGLIEDAFTGVAGTGSTYDATVGVNIPEGPIIGSGYTFLWYDAHAGNVFFYANNYGQSLLYGLDMPNHYTYGQLLTPTQAYNIDRKIDNGLPGSGNLLTFPSGTNLGCTTGDTTAATYVLSSVGTICSFIYLLREDY